jgi:hypothetical protein
MHCHTTDEAACCFLSHSTLARSLQEPCCCGSAVDIHSLCTRTHLVHPVGVEDTQAAQLAAGTLLCDVAKVPGRLQLRHTLVHWLAIHDTLHMPPTRHTPAVLFPAAAIQLTRHMHAALFLASAIHLPRRSFQNLQTKSRLLSDRVFWPSASQPIG